MPVLFVTYDLNSPGQNYENLIKVIENNSITYFTRWKSSFLVKSRLTPEEFTDEVIPYLDKNDNFIVIEVKNNKQGWLSNDDWDAINNHIFN
ncbi:hypothetical protein [Marinococcus sp. PL1-022]|uniref:hypothetical protein n=1 Tax=Marinococcus sp. PL1-022 TaxID=3095363 RepID=UPI0029C53409|nr:hypothetical protein [Marinococcus sp. PL1-022]MDX6154482.1 hypothetical protein [Marinococcus sp. PL1-022]